MNTISKIVTHIMHDRLSTTIDTHLRQQQAGFRSYRSCVDQIKTLHIIVEQRNELRSPLYMLFVDFDKAFESMNRELMRAALAA